MEEATTLSGQSASEGGVEVPSRTGSQVPDEATRATRPDRGPDAPQSEIILIGGDRIERDSVQERLTDGVGNDVIGRFRLDNASVSTGNDFTLEELEERRDAGAYVIDLGSDDVNDPVELEYAEKQRNLLNGYDNYYDLSSTMVRREEFGDQRFLVGENDQEAGTRVADAAREKHAVTYDPPLVSSEVPEEVKKAMNAAWVNRLSLENPKGDTLGRDENRAERGEYYAMEEIILRVGGGHPFYEEGAAKSENVETEPGADRYRSASNEDGGGPHATDSDRDPDDR
ncbi:MAG TPA: hypothetical protein VIG64_04360 [Actinomycetota bacterium]